MLENTESQEMYLTTIYALQKKNGMVRSVDVADERGYFIPLSLFYVNRRELF